MRIEKPTGGSQTAINIANIPASTRGASLAEHNISRLGASVDTSHNVSTSTSPKVHSNHSLLRRGNAALTTIWALTGGMQLAAAVMKFGNNDSFGGFLSLAAAGLAFIVVYVHSKAAEQKKPDNNDAE